MQNQKRFKDLIGNPMVAVATREEDGGGGTVVLRGEAGSCVQ